MVDYKSKYLSMKLKYINAKYQKGGAHHGLALFTTPGGITASPNAYADINNLIIGYPPSNFTGNITQRAYNLIGEAQSNSNFTTLGAALHNLHPSILGPNIHYNYNEDETQFYASSVDEALIDIRNRYILSAANIAAIDNILDTFRNQFKRADGSY